MNTLKEKIENLITTDALNVFDFVIDDGNTVERTVIRRANPCNDSYSVAKAFTMTAVGMLYDEGKLDISDKVTDILREEFEAVEGREEKWSEVTVDNALCHRMGIAKGFLDIDIEDASAYPTDDYLQLVFTHKIEQVPGENRVYSDAAYYLASRIVEKLAGETLCDFMWKRLFLPLGFREVSWSVCPKGHSMGATGLYIRTEDMVKLGRLFLNGGIWNGKRIISEDWIRIATDRGYDLYKRDGKNAYTKGGMNGQRLYFSYDDNLAVAWHGYESSKLTDKILTLL